MTKGNLETKVVRAVLNIAKSMLNVEKKVIDMDNVLRDLSMKFCYIIKHKGFGGDYYTLPEGIDYGFDDYK